MKITQVYEIVNEAVQQSIGETIVLEQDLTNVVDVGKAVIDADAIDAYVKKLVNHVGKVVFDDKIYTSGLPGIMMDSWEYGSILEKVSVELPEATKNDSWDLVDGQTYNQDIFYKPSVSAKFYNSKTTFEIPMSFTELQVKQSFSNESQLNGFISMLHNAITNSMTLQLDSLIMSTMNNMIAETIAADLDNAGTIDLTNGSLRAVNLLAKYNAETGKTLAKDKAMLDPDFIKFASFQMAIYKDRFTKMSKLFNIGGTTRFTRPEDLRLVLLSQFAAGASIYLEADTQHRELVSLPKYDTVPYWQGSGTDYSFAAVSGIEVIPSNYKKVVKVDGILGVMFDKNALAVANLDRRVTTNYNAKAEFYNNFYKLDAGFFNDFNENFVVFYIA